MFDKPVFKEWLTNQQGLGLKASRDVCSRLKRAERLLGSSIDLVNGEILDRVTSTPGWESIPDSSKAGIVRAVKLYKDFLGRS